jgi:hypothetical protein
MSSETQALTVDQTTENPKLEVHELEFLEFLFSTLVVKQATDDDELRRQAPNNVVLTNSLGRPKLLCFTNFVVELGMLGTAQSILYVAVEDEELSILTSPRGVHQEHLVVVLQSLINTALSSSVWVEPMEVWRNRINFLDFGYLWKHRQFCKRLNVDGQRFDVSTLGRDGWSFITIAGNQAGDYDTFTYGIQTADVSRSCDIVRAHGVNFAPPVKMFRYDAGDILPGPDYRQAKNRFDMVLAQLKKDLVDPAIL